MAQITTIEQLLDALPEGHDLDELLMRNLAVLALASEGKVDITGFDNGRLRSVNTALGRQSIVDDLVKEINR